MNDVRIGRGRSRWRSAFASRNALPNCEAKVKSALEAVPGVAGAADHDPQRDLEIEGGRPSLLGQALLGTGFRIRTNIAPDHRG
jgi:hypothetical protein